MTGPTMTPEEIQAEQEAAAAALQAQIEAAAQAEADARAEAAAAQAAQEALEAEWALIRQGPHKVVNGVPVALSAEEIAEREAEVAAAAAIRNVPLAVTPLQARRALRAVGLLDTVNAWVESQPDDDIKDAWQFALSIERHGPITLGAAVALGLTEEQLDDLFELAGSYK